MSEDKTEATRTWKILNYLRDVQSFLGFANFYRRFINGFSQVCRPLTESTKGDKKDWKWTKEMETALNKLKRRFTEAPILMDGVLHPIAYHSRQFIAAEINYEIHDKELLAVVDPFKCWRRYLEGVLKMVLVYSDHQNLEYFMTTKC
jgi:hypothetical protein